MNTTAFEILRAVMDDMINTVNSPALVTFNPEYDKNWSSKALEQHYIGGFARQALFNKFGIRVFNGEYKIVITHDLWNFVLKIARYDWDPARDDQHDEADDEYQIFKQATAFGVGYAFAEMAPFCVLPHGHTVYIQQKIGSTWENALTAVMNNYDLQEYRYFCATAGYDFNELEYDKSIDSRWLFFFKKKYGKKSLDELVKFIIDFDIYDLHDQNIGMTPEGCPIIFDYGGMATYN